LALDPLALGVAAAVFLLLLFTSAVASASEVALFSLGSTQREQLRLASDRASKRVVRLLERPRTILVSIVVLNTFANVMAAIIAAVVTARIAIRYGWSPAPTVMAEVLIIAFVLLFVCEVAPKLVAARNPFSFSRVVSAPLLVAHRVLSPVSVSIVSLIQRFQHRFADEVAPISADELKTMAEIGEEHGTIQEDERELIHSIIEFGETTVREIMVSRLDIRAIPVTCTLGEALAVIRESGHSRLPLYVDHLDNILGVVHAKDLLPNLSDSDTDRRLDWIRIARRPMFVPLGKKLDDLLRAFQEQKVHVAIVVDEYGGTAGLVTLEDVLEEIVGDIRDEHDESDDELYHRIDEGTFLCDSRLDLDDLNELLDSELETDDFDFETLGGLIYHLSGEVPREGDTFRYKNLELQVKSVDGRRIGDVVVRKVKREPANGTRQV
jgi:gliding motility-associated protein GldE